MWLKLSIYIALLSLILAGCATNSAPATTSMQVLSASAVAQQLVVGDGFVPSRDGFSFKNYGKATGVTNLTAPDMQRLFGNVVCVATISQTCALIPAARIWMEEINRAMQTGHCEGMAVLSQYFYYGVLKPAQFGAQQVSKLSLNDNPLLQREIAYWWATQATYPTRSQRVVSDPNAVVALLRDGLVADADFSKLYTLGIYLSDFSSGHTVTPIAVRDIDSSHVGIEIYDNNLPNETHEIVVDTQQNTWQYAATSLNGNAVMYHGDANSKNLELTAVAARLEKQVCHFCPSNPVADVVDGATTFFFSTTAQTAQIMSQQFSAYFVDDIGRKVGIVLGKVINEIPNAQIGFLRGAPAMWTPLGMPMLYIPSDINGTLRITGVAKSPINVTAFGQGSVVALQNMRVDEQLASEIRIDQSKGTVAVAAANDATPDIVVGYTDDSQNVEMTVKNVSLPRGAKAAVSTNRQNRTVSMLTSEKQSVTVKVDAQSNANPAPSSAEQTVVADDASLKPLLDSVAPSPESDVSMTATVVPTDVPTAQPTATAKPANNRPQATRTRQSTPQKPTPNNGSVDNDDDKTGSGDATDDKRTPQPNLTSTSVVSETVTMIIEPTRGRGDNGGGNDNGGGTDNGGGNDNGGGTDNGGGNDNGGGSDNGGGNDHGGGGDNGGGGNDHGGGDEDDHHTRPTRTDADGDGTTNKDLTPTATVISTRVIEIENTPTPTGYAILP